MRFLLNLAAIFVLVILLITPSVFSFNLVNFEREFSGISIIDNSEKFGEFLKILKVENNNFEIEFRTFAEKPALYRNFLEVENKDKSKTTVKIVGKDLGVEIFFNTGTATAGPVEIDLFPGEKVGINLIAKPAMESKTASFSLVSE